MLWAQIKGISSLIFSVLWRGSGDLLWHSGTCQLFTIIGIYSQISSPHILSCTAPVRKYCNAQYPVFCSYFAILLPFLTGHKVFCLLPAHHIPPHFCAVMSLHSPSTQLLCSLSMVILAHFPVSCHSLSAITSHLLKRRFCGNVEIGCGLRYLLKWCLDTVSLLFVNICSFPSPTNCPTTHPLNSHIY